jgi:hypothetical protein
MPVGGRRLRSFGLRCCSSRKAGSAQTRFAQTRAALIRLPLRCSPEPQQPPTGIPPTDVDTIVVISVRRAQSSRAPKPGRRCGPGEPLCAAEARSAIGCARSALQHLTRRSCLSEENEVNAASSATQPMARAPQGSREAVGAPGSIGPHRLPGTLSETNEEKSAPHLPSHQPHPRHQFSSQLRPLQRIVQIHPSNLDMLFAQRLRT